MRLSPRYDGPSILVFDGPADDQFEPVSRQRRRMEALLADLDDDGWASPTRCEEWTIQDVIAHLVTVNAFWEASVRAGLDGAPTRVLATFDPAAHPARMVDGMRALSPHEIFDQFVASNDGFIGALVKLDEQGWATRAESPPGHVPIRVLAQHALWDSWIHERDIALPIGRTPVQEPDEVRSCLRYAAALSPALDVEDDAPTGEVEVLGVVASGPDVRFTVEIGESVVVHDGVPGEGVPNLAGDAVQLVEALSIRGPLPADSPPEWHRALEDLQTVFDAGSRDR